MTATGDEHDLHPVVLHHIVNTLGWADLRPLQSAAVTPLVAGDDALLLAPTAGGKTEAAVFPILTAMEDGRWRGLTVLYVCPLKALLNNLRPRLETYTGWVGRRAALWHGDVTQSVRQRILLDLPDVLLTTPESLEAMLVSEKVDHRRVFADVRAVLIDEVHAFAGDDRGWHLLAVLERLTRITGLPIQRIGLSATVGNPAALLTWLQGSSRGLRPGRIVGPRPEPPGAPSTASGRSRPAVDVELDYVGSVHNAATVISALHRGEKRLVFCDSRRLVEELGAALRERGVTTFLSHASLSTDERRAAERAFAEARDCVIVSTSTLELGIDVGDLDRVIQLDAPPAVASFLQRLGRTGRRSGGTRNALLLALTRGLRRRRRRAAVHRPSCRGQVRSSALLRHDRRLHRTAAVHRPRRPAGDRPLRPDAADRADRRSAAAAARRSELEGHVDRLEAPPLPGGTRRQRREGPLGQRGRHRRPRRTDQGRCWARTRRSPSPSVP